MAKDIEQVNVTRHEGENDAPREVRVPVVDIVRTGTEYVMTAEMPGVGRDGAEAVVDEGVLNLRGRVGGDAAKRFDHQEYVAADFERRFTLSPEIDQGRITATMDNGVLTVHLPKREEAKLRKIQIQTSK